MLKRLFSTATKQHLSLPKFDSFRQQVRHAPELRNKDQELMRLAAMLNQKQPVDYKSRIERSLRQQQNELTEEDLRQMREEERVIEEKLQQVAKTRTYNEFVNAWTQNLMQKTPPNILSELGVRAYSGSRDVPQDLKKANHFFEAAAHNCQDDEMKLQVEYFQTITQRFQLQKELSETNQLINQALIEGFRQAMISLNEKLRDLAEEGQALASFSYAKDLYFHLQEGSFEEDQKLKGQVIEQVFHMFTYAALKGVHSAHFYMGLILYEGHFAKQDIPRALEHYVQGAAKNNAFCFFELSRIYSEGEYVTQNHMLAFEYLKRSAEEGFVSAQHLLGIHYYQGDFCKKDDRKALGWFRESVRNGNPLSYLNAAEILKQPGELQNLMFSLVNYMGAYQHGALFLKDEIEQLRQQLVAEGYRIPEFQFAETSQVDAETQEQFKNQ